MQSAIPEEDLQDTLVYMGGRRCGASSGNLATTFNDVWALAEDLQWRPLGAHDCTAVQGGQRNTGCAPWSTRHGFAAAVAEDVGSPTGQMLYVMGGVRHGLLGNDIFLNDVWRSCDGATWQMVTNAARWSARGYSVLQVLGNVEQNALFLFGGKDTTGTSCSDSNHPNGELCRSDVWASKDHGLTWTQIESDSSSPWIGRTSCSVVPVRVNMGSEGLEQGSPLYGICSNYSTGAYLYGVHSNLDNQVHSNPKAHHIKPEK